MSSAAGPPVRAQSGVKPNKPPGPIHLALTAVSLLILVCIYYDWWPSRYGTSSWADPMLFGAAALLILAALGLVWAVKTLYVIGQDRRWSWWIAAAPAVLLVAVATVMLAPRPSFDDTRAEFEQVALELLADPEPLHSHLEIGRFDIRTAMSGDDGVVYFIEDGGLGLTVSSGWAYSPHGVPAGFDDFTATHLGGPWYKFISVWRT
jgi:hypothetical protein